MEARKRRKWDVAAPGGMPLSGHRAGIGAIGSGKAAKTGLSGFITAQGLQIDPPEALEPVSAPVTPAVPARPLSEQEIVARAKQEAQAVVERINAELRAKGQLPPGRGQSRFQDDSRDIFREVVINDAPHGVRMELIKRGVQDDIQRRTHTIVVIKGRYQPQGAPPHDMEGPLRLRITPGNVGPDDMVKQRAVDNGASEVRRIMQGGSTSRGHAGPAMHIPPPDRLSGFVSAGGEPAFQPPIQQALPMPQAPWQVPQQPPDVAQSVSLYVAVDAPPEFNLIFKLRGPGDSYLQHISGTTGASVTLRGRGAGGMYDSPDHLHLFVTAPNPKSFEDAKGLAVNLIDTVRAEHAKVLSAAAPQPAPMPVQSQAPAPSMPQHSQPPMAGQPYPQMQPQQGQRQQEPERQGHSQRGYQYEGQQQQGQGQQGQGQQMPMHSQAPPMLQQASGQPSGRVQGPGNASTANAPLGSVANPNGPQWQPPGAGNQVQSNQGPYPSSSLPPNAAAPAQPAVPSSYPQQHPPASSFPMSNPYPTPNARPAAAYNMNMPQPTGAPYPSPASGANMPAGQRPPPSQAQNSQFPAGPYQPKPGVQGPQLGMPYDAAPAGPYAAPYGGSQGSQRSQQQPGSAMQQQQGGYGLHQHGSSAGQAPLGPVHGPHRPPEMSQDASRGSAQGGSGRILEQNSRNRPNHNGMSASDVQAQQAERKRRFTEQKAQAQWKQGQTQQPAMPAYAQRPSQPIAPLPAEPNPPLPMGPPPPRPPVQFKLGSMGPPPPRFNRVQGGHQGAVSGPPQGLVPYGDDD